MELGIHYANFTLPGGPEAMGPTLAATAQAAEDGGCSVFTLMDHWFQMEAFATSQDPMLEGYTALGFLAGQTERMTLALLVTGVTYRHPGLLAKIVTTLDIVSGGRAQLGIGAAWYEREHLGLGVPFPPLSERFERLEEALQICHQMWSDDDGPYQPAAPLTRPFSTQQLRTTPETRQVAAASKNAEASPPPAHQPPRAGTTVVARRLRRPRLQHRQPSSLTSRLRLRSTTSYNLQLLVFRFKPLTQTKDATAPLPPAPPRRRRF